MNIGLDLDGVVYPWHDSLYRHFREFKGYEGTEREFWKYVNELPKDVQQYFVSIPLLYFDTTPTEDVLTYLPKLAELGTIYYITNRPPEVKSITRKFFDFFKFPFKENVIFTDTKANYVRLHNVEVYLDDRGKNVDELIGLTDVYLFKAVHNWAYRDNYKVIYSFKEFYEMLKGRIHDSKVD